MLAGLVFLLFLQASASFAADARLTVLVNPGPFSGIEEAARGEGRVDWWDGDPADDRACTECFAAAEIRRFIPRCTLTGENDIGIERAEKLPETGDVILVGSRRSNPLIAAFDLPAGARLETGESFFIGTFQRDGRTVTVIEGGDRVGALYGVYRYLELLGMRFYGLGETGTVAPQAPTAPPDSLAVVENPSYLTRGYHAWEDRGDETFFLWMARNRMNFWTSAEKEIPLLKKLGMKLADGGHVIQLNFLDPAADYPYDHPVFSGDESKPRDPYEPGSDYSGDTNGDGKLSYFEAHPEWYGLFDGKRSDNIKDEFGDNFCTSNPDACRELAKNMIASLADGDWRHVDIVNFWMMDGTKRWCQCGECAKLGTYTDKLIALVDIMLRELDRARSTGLLRRRVELSSLAYLETIEPPTRPLPEDFDYDNFSMTFFPIERCYDHTLADPSCTEYNARLRENYLAWTTGSGGRYRGAMFIGEYYNVSYLKTMPMLYTRVMAADVPWYHAAGARHFHYMHAPSRLWGTWTLNQYLLGRLLWDVSADTDAVLDEYFALYYPSTTEVTRRFYTELETAMTPFKSFRYWGWKNRLKTTGGELFPKKHFRYREEHPATNDGGDLLEMVHHIRAARNALDEALLLCADPSELARLLEDERRFGYGELMVFFHYHLFRTAMLHRKGDAGAAAREFEKLDRIAVRLGGITDLTAVSSSHANADDGFAATQATDVVAFFRERYGR